MWCYCSLCHYLLSTARWLFRGQLSGPTTRQARASVLWGASTWTTFATQLNNKFLLRFSCDLNTFYIIQSSLHFLLIEVIIEIRRFFIAKTINCSFFCSTQKWHEKLYVFALIVVPPINRICSPSPLYLSLSPSPHLLRQRATAAWAPIDAHKLPQPPVWVSVWVGTGNSLMQFIKQL